MVIIVGTWSNGKHRFRPRSYLCFNKKNERINEMKFTCHYKIQFVVKEGYQERVHFEVGTEIVPFNITSIKHLAYNFNWQKNLYTSIEHLAYTLFLFCILSFRRLLYVYWGGKVVPEYAQHLRRQKLEAHIYLPVPSTCS